MSMTYHAGPIEVTRKERLVLIAGRKVRVSRSECDVLELLVRRRAHGLTIGALAGYVYQGPTCDQPNDSEAAIRVILHHLRAKVRGVADIRTSHGRVRLLLGSSVERSPEGAV
jgi:DNA-binding response OmpR family regulator